MTNRQWLAGLSDEALTDLLLLKATPRGCPPGVVDPNDLRYDIDPCPTMDGCCACWLDWLRAECDKPTTSIYDVVEEHHGCMVQVLKNSVTGEMSVGWKKNE